jgi:hypothetical protein
VDQKEQMVSCGPMLYTHVISDNTPTILFSLHAVAEQHLLQTTIYVSLIIAREAFFVSV